MSSTRIIGCACLVPVGNANAVLPDAGPDLVLIDAARHQNES